MSSAPPPLVQVALDDAAAGAQALALSTALAQSLGGELAVVYVENRSAVSAAALPDTQVLPHAGSAWLPLRPDDVEQGFRTQAARLRQLVERTAADRRLRWSLRVVRGSLAEVLAGRHGGSSLLFLAPAPLPGPLAAGGSRPPVVALTDDDGDDASATKDMAARLAHALGGSLQAWPPGSGREGWSRLAGWARPDVLVVTRRILVPGTLPMLKCPLLVVG